jgi:hypothetical protein
MSALASPGAERAQQGGMPPAVRELAAELLPRAPELARGLTDHLVANMPELSAGDDDLREETRASVEGNVDQVLRLLKLGAGADTLRLHGPAREWTAGPSAGSVLHSDPQRERGLDRASLLGQLGAPTLRRARSRPGHRRYRPVPVSRRFSNLP